jgi:DNA-binding NarL/FixJ family response regulator
MRREIGSENVVWQVIATRERLRLQVERLLQEAGRLVLRRGVLPLEVRLNAVRAAMEISDGERAVLEAWLDCDTQQQVADRLCISLDTVETHTRAIFQTLGAHSRHRAIVHAIGAGLLEAGSSRRGPGKDAG